MSIVAGTGHRPHKLWIGDYSGHHPMNPLRAWVKNQARSKLAVLKPIHVISGLALGFDQDLADVCVDMGIPFIAAIPCEGQDSQWPLEARAHYQKLLKLAYEVVLVNDGPYERWKMQARNEWMVDHCSDLLACFDGSQGGTANTVNYADKLRRPVHRIDPNELRQLLAPQGAAL